MGALALVLCVVGLSGAADPAQAAVGEADELGEGVIVELNTELTTIEVINSRYGSTILDDYFASIGIYLLKPPDDKDVKTFAQDLVSGAPQNGVVYAEPNYVAETPEDPTAGDGRMRARAISDRKRAFTNQYAAEYLDLSCAAEISGGEGVTVAVLDTGAQLGHPALKANFSGVTRYDFVDNDTKPSEKLDADRNGKRDQLAGHGTHVAGIVDRVAPAAKIMPLRVLNSEGRGNAYTIAKAISYAERYGTDVLNLSLGSSQRSELLQDMIGHAIDRSVVVAAAAGNSDTETPHYPAAGNYGTEVSLSPPSTAGLLAVSSVVPFVDRDGYEYERKSDFATYGEWVSIAVPGEDIRSAFPVDKYANWSGTSMATPFISGQAALIRSLYEQQSREFEPADIKNEILTSVQEFTEPPKYGDPPEYEDLYAAWIYSHHDPLAPLEPYKLGPGHVNVCDSLQ
jgi:subtilisin family serine protease